MKQLQEKLLALLLIFILSGATASAQKAADKNTEKTEAGSHE